MKFRFKAYKFYKDGKPLPGYLSIRYGKAIPEFYHPLGFIPPLAGKPAHGVDLSPFYNDSKSVVDTWKRHRGADRVIKIIVER